MGSSFSSIPIEVVGGYPKLSTKPTVLSFTDAPTGPNKDRQEASHPHQAYYSADRDEVFVPDLGVDKVWRLTRGLDGQWERRDSVDFPAGTGPRHCVVFDGTLYTLLELSNELSAHRIPHLPESPGHIATVSTLARTPDENKLAAEVRLVVASEISGPLIYTSNRTYRGDPPPEGDSIAIFTPHSESAGTKFSKKAEVPTGLHHVRGMTFSEDGRYVIVGGLFGGGIKVFERVKEGGGLVLREVISLPEKAEDGGVEQPTDFLWL